MKNVTTTAGKPEPLPPQAAKGDDDLMSTAQGDSKMHTPSVDELKGKWKERVGAVKVAWGKLTEDEILASEGREEKLAGLIQQRYAITRDEAKKQVKAFMDKHRS
ncbi:CsbD family protein [Marinobacter sp. C2H3]|uniref:CsbD family protein n=1 Tax=Marinobacter sp. C2H3 TaxID=3119003 RepID=UPI00300F27DC